MPPNFDPEDTTDQRAAPRTGSLVARAEETFFVLRPALSRSLSAPIELRNFFNSRTLVIFSISLDTMIGSFEENLWPLFDTRSSSAVAATAEASARYRSFLFTSFRITFSERRRMGHSAVNRACYCCPPFPILSTFLPLPWEFWKCLDLSVDGLILH